MQNKRSLFVCLLVILTLCATLVFATPVAAEGSSLQIIVGVEESTPAVVYEGETFVVNVELENNTTGISVFQFALDYDAENLEYVSFANGDVFNQIVVQQRGENKLVWIYMGSKCEVEQGTMVSFTFKAKKTIDPRASFKIENDSITGQTGNNFVGGGDLDIQGNPPADENGNIAVHTHVYTKNEVSATCTENAYDRYECACGYYYDDVKADTATGHTQGEVVVENETAADCVNNGSYDNVVYCTVCNEELSRETITVEAPGHTAGEVQVENEKAADCVNDGSYDNVVYCTVCGAEVSRETITVPALGHTEGEVKVENNVPATCLNNGSYDNVVYCTVCDAEVSRETITVDALGHTEVEIAERPATCTSIGYTAGARCSVCGVITVEPTIIEAREHTPADAVVENEVAPDCVKDGRYESVVYCSVCNEELSRVVVKVDALGHTDEAIPAVAPTCTSIGYTAGARCSVCGVITVEPTVDAALGHTPAAVVVENNVAPNCVKDGRYENVVYCSVCNEELSRVVVKVDALGHTPAAVVVENNVAPNCVKDGRYENVVYCSVCNEELSRVVVKVDALGHTPAEAVKENEVAPNCVKDGRYESVVYCSVCNEELSRETITVKALGHTPAEAVVENEVAPNCVKDGRYESVVYCSVPECKEELSRETITVEALGHTPAEAVVENEVAPTCVKDGRYESVVYCSVCNEELNRETITVEALGHTPAESVKENEVAPDCVKDGRYESVIYCTVCKQALSKVVVKVYALGHTEAEIPAVAPTCTTAGSANGKKCSVCETILVAPEVVQPTGHTIQVTDAKEPTYSEDGCTKEEKCTVCGEITVPAQTIPALSLAWLWVLIAAVVVIGACTTVVIILIKKKKVIIAIK
jgi:hypothetical protein